MADVFKLDKAHGAVLLGSEAQPLVTPHGGEQGLELLLGGVDRQVANVKGIAGRVLIRRVDGREIGLSIRQLLLLLLILLVLLGLRSWLLLLLLLLVMLRQRLLLWVLLRQLRKLMTLLLLQLLSKAHIIAVAVAIDAAVNVSQNPKVRRRHWRGGRRGARVESQVCHCLADGVLRSSASPLGRGGLTRVGK